MPPEWSDVPLVRTPGSQKIHLSEGPLVSKWDNPLVKDTTGQIIH